MYVSIGRPNASEIFAIRYLAFQSYVEKDKKGPKNEDYVLFSVIPIRSFNGGIGLKVRMKTVKAVYLGW